MRDLLRVREIALVTAHLSGLLHPERRQRIDHVMPKRTLLQEGVDRLPHVPGGLEREVYPTFSADSTGCAGLHELAQPRSRVGNSEARETAALRIFRKSTPSLWLLLTRRTPSDQRSAGPKHAGHVRLAPTSWWEFTERLLLSPGFPGPGAESSIGLRCHPRRHDLLEGYVVHEPDEDLLILVHALDEQLIQEVLEHQLELVARIDTSCLAQAIVGHCCFDSLVEKELVRLVEVCPEALVDNIDELRQRHGLWSHEVAPNFGGSIEAPGFTILQGDRPVGLEFVIRPPLEAGPCPGSGSIQRTWLNSARAAVRSPAKSNGV